MSVYTGSDSDGTSALVGDFPLGEFFGLGASSVRYGTLNTVLGDPLSAGEFDQSSFPPELPLYGLSGVFQVQQQAVGPSIVDGGVEVTSDPGDDDTYAIGDTIEITVTFDETLTVNTSAGTPRIQLRYGSAEDDERWADYESGTSTEALVFAYTVVEGDLDDNGIYIAQDELDENGGTIQSLGGIDADLDYAEPGAQAGHKVDGVRPLPTSAATTTDGGAIRITFNEPLSDSVAAPDDFDLSVTPGPVPTVTGVVTSDDGGVYRLSLALSDSLTNAQTVTVTYADPTNLDDPAAIQDKAGNDAVTFTTGQGTVPAIENKVPPPSIVNNGVEVTSDPGGDDTYAIGDTIEITVTFDETLTVNISGGTPRIQLRYGSAEDDERWADYESGTSTEALVFAYTVAEGDLDDDGIWLEENQLVLNGGTIQSSGGIDADLGYSRPGRQAGHKVDGVRPTVVAAATSRDGTKITLIFSQALSAASAGPGAFGLTVGEGTAPTVTAVSVSDDAVDLTLSSALTASQAASVSVTYTDPGDSDNADAVQDAAGNDAVTFTTGASGVAAVLDLFATETEVAANWGLVPAGLGVGDRFRLIFVSSTTRDAQSADIGDYNAFVQTAAAAGHSDITDYSADFTAVGSTPSVDARDNTRTRFIKTDKGVAIYYLGGNKVADDYEDFYDGSWHGFDPTNELGEAHAGIVDKQYFNHSPFTGSDHDGTESIDEDSSRSKALGTSFDGVAVGWPFPLDSDPNALTDAGPLKSDEHVLLKTASRPFYGLSGVLRVGDPVNSVPVFAEDMVARSVLENSPGGTSVGDPVTATDADDDALSYSLGGADAASFVIHAATGQISSAAGAAFDFESVPASYSVTVTAADDNGGTATVAVTISVSDVDEPPPIPAAPSVVPVADATDSLSVSWTAPDTTGIPPVVSYDLRYRTGNSGAWTDGPQDVAGTSAVIGGLDAGSDYQVQVRAANDEGDSDWSPAGTGTTGAAEPAPAITGVEVTSDPGDDDTYAIGDTIEITVTFDAKVAVTGTPRIQLRYGGDPADWRWAHYESSTDTGELVFAYTVAEGDLDDNGIWLAGDQLKLNGGTIQSPGGTDADLGYSRPGAQAGHKVDGVRPAPTSAVAYGTTISIVFDEALSETTAPPSAFLLGVDEGTAPMVTSVSASGPAIVLTLDSALTAAQAGLLTLTYTDPDDADVIQDAAGNDAATFTTGQDGVPAIAGLTACPDETGCFVVPFDWGLIPDGLNPGEQFRLIFVSSTRRDATSDDIGDYNAFVQAAAAAGHDDITDYSTTFTAVGSTAAVDARQNTSTRYGGDTTSNTGDDAPGRGVPIYWLDGTQVADDYRDFYDGDWDNEAKGKDESGSDRSFSPNTDTWPFTGSDHNGTESVVGTSRTSLALGVDGNVKVGRPTDTATRSGPLSSATSRPSTAEQRFYGLSAVLQRGDPPAPVVSSVAVTSDPGSDDTYAIGDVIEVTVTFDQAVTVGTAGGTPFLELNVGGAQRQATFASGSGTETLVFAYTVAENDADGNGVAIGAHSLAHDGGTIKWGDGVGPDAVLTHIAVGDDAEHLVDGVRPKLVPDGVVVSDDRIRINLEFDEVLTESISGVGAFTVTAAGTDRPVSSVAAVGKVVTLTLSSAVAADVSVTVAYTDPSDQEGDEGAIRDKSGNDAASFVQVVGNSSPVFSSAATFSAPENQTDVGTVAADDDDDGDTVSYALTGGADRAAFAIDTDSGVLTFTTAPDFENPVDADTDNIYDVTVTATSGANERALTATQDITVTVTDVDEPAATISTVTLTSDPGTAETYAIGDTIQATVTFDMAVTVNTDGGTPYVVLRVGGGDLENLKHALYDSGTDTTELVFAYTVAEDDFDHNGIWLAADELVLDGGTITTTAAGKDAVLTYSLPGAQSGHNVDGVRPMLATGHALADSNGSIVGITLIFSETLSAATAPADAFAVSVGSGTPPAVNSVTASDATVTLALSADLTEEQVASLSVTYTDPTAEEDAAAIQDVYGNDAATFTTGVDGVPAIGNVFTVCDGVDNCYVVPVTWGLLPSDFAAGGYFRLIFLSSTTRDGSSADIDVYNRFIQDRAAAGHQDIQQYSFAFKAVGSTGTTDARDNTGTRYVGDTTGSPDDDAQDRGVPIYWLGGNRVADDYRDFYDGSWAEEINTNDESGTDHSIPGVDNRPRTGSNANGAVSISGNLRFGLGDNNVQFGELNTAGASPFTSTGSIGVKADYGPFYGLSPLFFVLGRRAPEISSAATFTVPENHTGAVGTVVAADEDPGDTVRYAITGGPDMDDLRIDADSGELTFAAPPDYENPADAGADNLYEVTVAATSGTGDRLLSATQDITVTVTDVDETPTITSVDVTSTPTATADTYGGGETIEVTVTFDWEVTVTGTPRIQLRVGGGQTVNLKWAEYDGGSSTALRFAYEVQSGDSDDNGYLHRRR